MRRARLAYAVSARSARDPKGKVYRYEGAARKGQDPCRARFRVDGGLAAGLPVYPPDGRGFLLRVAGGKEELGPHPRNGSPWGAILWTAGKGREEFRDFSSQIGLP